MGNFADEVTAAAVDSGDRPAIKLDEAVMTYAALDAAVGRTAARLRDRGVAAGDRVGVLLPNTSHFPTVYLAVLRIGAVVVPMNPLLKRGEVAHQLRDAGARLLVGWHVFAAEAGAGCEQAGVDFLPLEPGGFDAAVADMEAVTETADRADDDAAVIIYTSGTTGTPKGATLTHSNLRAAAATAADLVAAGPGSVAVGALPLFHVFAMNCLMNATLLSRGLLTLVTRFDPLAVLEIIQRDRATTFAGVPTMYTALLNHPERGRFDVSSLSLCVSGGSAIPVEVLRRFDEAFNAVILEGYGLSETTGMASFNVRTRSRKPGSIGVPVGGTEMRAVDDDGAPVPPGAPGEIVVRGPFLMAGYWGDDCATADAIDSTGWFRTGDIATVDDDGYFFIVDRKKDLIIRGGYNVYPREVEEGFYSHPAVAEAAVVGVSDDTLGEEVGAAVVLKSGADASAEELIAHVKAQVAPYKYPRRIWFADELPKGPSGKILKREIRAPAPRNSTDP